MYDTTPYRPTAASRARVAAIKASTHKLPEGYTCQRTVCPAHSRPAVVKANAWASRLLVPAMGEAAGRVPAEPVKTCTCPTVKGRSRAVAVNVNCPDHGDLA